MFVLLTLLFLPRVASKLLRTLPDHEPLECPIEFEDSSEDQKTSKKIIKGWWKKTFPDSREDPSPIDASSAETVAEQILACPFGGAGIKKSLTCDVLGATGKREQAVRRAAAKAFVVKHDQELAARPRSPMPTRVRSICKWRSCKLRAKAGMSETKYVQAKVLIETIRDFFTKAVDARGCESNSVPRLTQGLARGIDAAMQDARREGRLLSGTLHAINVLGMDPTNLAEDLDKLILGLFFMDKILSGDAKQSLNYTQFCSSIEEMKVLQYAGSEQVNMDSCKALYKALETHPLAP